MKTTLLLFILIPAITFGQRTGVSPGARADSIVTYFLGSKMVRDYLQRDQTKSKPTGQSDHVSRYKFLHPVFGGEPFMISLAIDSTGMVLPTTQGLFRAETPDSTWISRSDAFRICRQEAHHVTRNSLRLSWDSTDVSYDAYQKTLNYKDIVPGRLVWLLDGEVLFRGKKYSGTFEVDVQTGRLTKRFAIPWD